MMTGKTYIDIDRHMNCVSTSDHCESPHHDLANTLDVITDLTGHTTVVIKHQNLADSSDIITGFL